MKNAEIRKTREIAPFGVRIPAEIKDALTAAARQNGRSLNAEVVLRLQQSFEPREGPLNHMAQNLAPYRSTRPLSELEEAMLDVFNKLSLDKRAALINLFK